MSTETARTHSGTTETREAVSVDPGGLNGAAVAERSPCAYGIALNVEKISVEMAELEAAMERVGLELVEAIRQLGPAAADLVEVMREVRR